MSEPSFFAELKRRNVYKVAVAYAVVAWLLIQAASIILPAFEAPAWTMKVLIAALAIGFPIARALPLIEHALSVDCDTSLTSANLRQHPVWDRMRNDPRFQKLTNPTP